MEYTTLLDGIWHNFSFHRFAFEEYDAIIVFPRESNINRSFAIKTEYWDAFPEAIELSLLDKGFHLCYIKNKNRWGTDEDLDRKARFIRYLQKSYNLHAKCVAIGMSCGGLIAIKLAAKYPSLISCLYLDAPVVNYMSCPCGFGIGRPLSENNSEILEALGLESISQLLSYRDMPLDRINTLIESRIPVTMSAGDSDLIVPYCENGILLENAYRTAGIDFEVHICAGRAHHPHGIENPDSILRFILDHCD